MPIVQIPIKSPRSLGFTALRNIISDGKDSVVTPIINDKTVPSCAPLARSASAIGIVPKILAYIGIPITVASTTPNGLLLPSKDTIHSSGIQL